MKSLWSIVSLSVVLLTSTACNSKVEPSASSSSESTEQQSEASEESQAAASETGNQSELRQAEKAESTVDASESTEKEIEHEAPPHAAPDQDKIDSIKAAKLKKKK